MDVWDPGARSNWVRRDLEIGYKILKGLLLGCRQIIFIH
jgi:hypothetical protein